MKKFLFVISAILFAVPGVSLAAINSLNGLTGTTQTLATTSAATSTMHMRILSSGTSHSFRWDNTPWLMNQGGTGATSFATSSIPFINNGVFSQNNLQFFWDAVNNILNIGGTTTPATKLSIRGSGGLGLLNIASSTGSSLFYVSGTGNIGISTVSPSEKLDVVGNGKFSGSLQANTLNVSATSTIIGPVGIGNSSPQHALDVSGAMYSRLVTASGSNINWNAGNVQSLTLSSNPTLTFSNGQAGGEYKLIVKQDGTGNRTVTWPVTVKWFGGGTPPTLTNAANSTDMMSFVYTGNEYLGSFNLNALGTPPPPPPVTAIAFAATSTPIFINATDTGMTGNTITISGSNILLLVNIFSNPALINPTVTCNGTPMTLLQTGADTGDGRDYTFVLRGATTCAPVATWNSVTGYKYMMAVAYSGVDQTADPVTFNNQTRSAAPSPITISLGTDAVANSWVVTFASTGLGTIINMTNGTIKTSVEVSGFMTGDSDSIVATSSVYSTQLSWGAGSQVFQSQMIEISPAL